MNLIKNDDADDEAVMKFLEKQLKNDEEWLKLMKIIFKTCHKEMPNHYEEFQKHANFTKAECDVKYEWIAVCIESVAVIVKF